MLEYNEKKHHLSQSLKIGQTGLMLNMYNEYFHSLEEQEKKINHKINALVLRKEEERKRLISVVNECKMLENLKTYQYEEYMAEEQRQQQLMINDIISYKFSVD